MLNFRKTGSGEPLVMLHGLFGSLESLAGIGRQLSASYTVYAVDLPNHGRSKHITGSSLSAFAQEVASWMDSQGIRNPTLLGHSMGGKVAMELALMQPEAVQNLVVLDISPASYPPRHNEIFAGLAAVNLAAIRTRGDADMVLRDYETEESVRTFLLKNLARQGEEFVWRLNLDDLKRSYPQLIAANRPGLFDGPVLFLKSARSNYIQAEHKEDMLSRFPNVQLKVVAEAGHWLHAEKPDMVSRLVQRFISSR